MTKIALGMIVKNEAHCIERCLDSVKPIVDKIIFNDNGSTDNTVDIISKWCGKNGIPYGYIPDPWVSFDVNRSKVLEIAYKSDPWIDYVLMIDADEVIVFNAGFNIEEWKKSLICDIYDIETRLGGTSYFRPQLTSNKKKFAYAGVVHEFLKPLEDVTSRDTVKGFFNMPLQDSARNKDPEKYKKDAEVLLNILGTETDPFLRSRYRFYLAQSYKDSGQNKEAIWHYLERTKEGFWEEEKYISILNAGRLMRVVEPWSKNDILATFIQAIDFSPNRVEALYEAMITCRDIGKMNAAYVFGKEALTKSKPSGCLFLEDWIYDYALAFEMSVIAWYANDKELARNLTQYTIDNKKAPQFMRDQSIKNLEFYK